MGGFFLLATSLVRGGIADLLCCLLRCSLECLKTLKKMRLHVQDQIRYIFYF